MIYKAHALILKLECAIIYQRGDIMSKNYLLIYSEQLATDIELMCQSIKAPSNTLFQIRKSSSSVYANIREANYGQSKQICFQNLKLVLKNVAKQKAGCNYCSIQMALMKIHTKNIAICAVESDEC